MLETSAFEDDAILQALRAEPRKVDGSIDTYGGEIHPRVNSRAKLVFRKQAELVSRCEYVCISSFELARWPLTFGTTSLNHGFGDSSSENQAVVAELLSLKRLCISHSAVYSAN